MLKAGQNRTRYRGHVYIYLELSPITVGRKQLWRPLPFAIPCSPLLSFPGFGSAGWPRGCRGEGRAALAAAPAVPGLGGQAASAARGSGKMALLGSLPAFVAQFHPLSSPTGAILRSFLLPPRPARAVFLCFGREAFLPWALGASPRNPKSLASLPYPHSVSSPWSPS